ncbi:hypothetical protein BC940DRAFT_324135 [Gongronella butleri]|nr:hypothetical protein BC940DRAFT_324135 [Gongronella butleri]
MADTIEREYHTERRDAFERTQLFLRARTATCLFLRIHRSPKGVSVPMNPVSKSTEAWKIAVDFSEMLATTTAPAKTLSVMTLPSMTLPSTFFSSFFWFPSVFSHSDAFQKMAWFKVLALLDPSKQFVMIYLHAAQALNFLVLQLNLLWKVATPRVVWIKQGVLAIAESVFSNARHWLLGNVSKNTMGMIFDQLDDCGDPGVLAKHNDAPVPCGDDPQNDYSDVSGDLRDDLLNAPTGQASGNNNDHKGTGARCDSRAPTTASLGDAPFSFFPADMSRAAPLSGDAKNISTTGSDQLSQDGAHGAGKSVNATKNRCL